MMVPLASVVLFLALSAGATPWCDSSNCRHETPATVLEVNSVAFHTATVFPLILFPSRHVDPSPPERKALAYPDVAPLPNSGSSSIVPTPRLQCHLDRFSFNQDPSAAPSFEGNPQFCPEIASPQRMIVLLRDYMLAPFKHVMPVHKLADQGMMVLDTVTGNVTWGFVPHDDLRNSVLGDTHLVGRLVYNGSLKRSVPVTDYVSAKDLDYERDIRNAEDVFFNGPPSPHLVHSSGQEPANIVVERFGGASAVATGQTLGTFEEVVYYTDAVWRRIFALRPRYVDSDTPSGPNQRPVLERLDVERFCGEDDPGHVIGWRDGVCGPGGAILFEPLAIAITSDYIWFSDPNFLRRIVLATRTAVSVRGWSGVRDPSGRPTIHPVFHVEALFPTFMDDSFAWFGHQAPEVGSFAQRVLYMVDVSDAAVGPNVEGEEPKVSHHAAPPPIKVRSVLPSSAGGGSIYSDNPLVSLTFLGRGRLMLSAPYEEDAHTTGGSSSRWARFSQITPTFPLPAPPDEITDPRVTHYCQRFHNLTRRRCRYGPAPSRSLNCDLTDTALPLLSNATCQDVLFMHRAFAMYENCYGDRDREMADDFRYFQCRLPANERPTECRQYPNATSFYGPPEATIALIDNSRKVQISFTHEPTKRLRPFGYKLLVLRPAEDPFRDFLEAPTVGLLLERQRVAASRSPYLLQDMQDLYQFWDNLTGTDRRFVRTSPSSCDFTWTDHFSPSDDCHSVQVVEGNYTVSRRHCIFNVYNLWPVNVPYFSDDFNTPEISAEKNASFKHFQRDYYFKIFTELYEPARVMPYRLRLTLDPNIPSLPPPSPPGNGSEGGGGGDGGAGNLIQDVIIAAPNTFTDGRPQDIGVLSFSCQHQLGLTLVCALDNDSSATGWWISDVNVVQGSQSPSTWIVPGSKFVNGSGRSFSYQTYSVHRTFQYFANFSVTLRRTNQSVGASGIVIQVRAGVLLLAGNLGVIPHVTATMLDVEVEDSVIATTESVSVAFRSTTHKLNLASISIENGDGEQRNVVRGDTFFKLQCQPIDAFSVHQICSFVPGGKAISDFNFYQAQPFYLSAVVNIRPRVLVRGTISRRQVLEDPIKNSSSNATAEVLATKGLFAVIKIDLTGGVPAWNATRPGKDSMSSSPVLGQEESDQAAVIGVIVGCIVCVLLIIGTAVAISRWRRRRQCPPPQIRLAESEVADQTQTNHRNEERQFGGVLEA